MTGIEYVKNSLAIQPGQTSLDEDLEAWTLHNQHNATFSLPNGTKREASAVMLQAFHESISELSKTLGNDPTRWQWGKLHTREITSLLGAGALSYGPRASGGDDWTPNAAGAFLMDINDPATLMPAEHGPSWRMIVDWGSGQAEGVYPGGQDENPASPWYENEIAAWWNGRAQTRFLHTDRDDRAGVCLAQRTGGLVVGDSRRRNADWNTATPGMARHASLARRRWTRLGLTVSPPRA
jgi:acyl-homoserine lactone acylase PvdQ